MAVVKIKNGDNTLLRSITGFFLVFIITGAVLSGAYFFLLLMFTILLLSLNEFYRLFYDSNIQPRLTLGIFLSVVIWLSSFLVFLQSVNWQIIIILIPTVASFFYIELFRKAPNPFINLAITFMGIICITLPLLCFTFIAFLPNPTQAYQPLNILSYFFMIWASDTGAYIVGKAIGKHKLFLRISPGKTWEGTIGGALITLIVAFTLSYFKIGILHNNWITLTLIIVITGILGDLTKSLLKRSLEIKDSGNILPGHGGMLDRFDSLIGSAPFVFSYYLIQFF
jgi:phosphatidate cytidylyltransferase